MSEVVVMGASESTFGFTEAFTSVKKANTFFQEESEPGVYVTRQRNSSGGRVTVIEVKAILDFNNNTFVLDVVIRGEERC